METLKICLLYAAWLLDSAVKWVKNLGRRSKGEDKTDDK